MAEIFLMEDSGALRRIVTRYLRDAGHNVTGFENGIASSDFTLLEHADILITDLSMPEVDGRQVIRNIREIRPDLPIIVITGEELFDDPIVELADGFLQKPFDEPDLVRKVEDILGNSNQSILESVNECESQCENDDADTWPSTSSNDVEPMRAAAFCTPVQEESWLTRLKAGIAMIFSRR